MDEIRAMAGPIVQRHFDKVEAERQRIEAEAAAKKAAEEEAKKAAEAEKAAAAEAEKAAQSNGDAEMKDAEAPQPETEEAGDPK